jgi:hypothetical protein
VGENHGLLLKAPRDARKGMQRVTVFVFMSLLIDLLSAKMPDARLARLLRRTIEKLMNN